MTHVSLIYFLTLFLPNSELINDQDLYNRCAQLFSETLLPNMSITKTLNESKVLEGPKLIKKTRKAPLNLHEKKNRSQNVELKLEDKINSAKINNHGQQKFNKREDKKLKTVIQDIWDSQLHSELEKELDLESSEMEKVQKNF